MNKLSFYPQAENMESYENKSLVAGVIGNPINQSRSSLIHKYWLKKHNINGHYIPLHLHKHDLNLMFTLVKNETFKGFNVTIPFKTDVLKFADELTLAAASIGAANTIFLRNDGKVIADNTDYIGFLDSLHRNQPNYNFHNETVLIYGAGGASYAVVYAYLKSKVKKIRIINRTLSKAKDLASKFSSNIDVYDWNDQEDALKGTTTIVNTTSLGMLNSKRDKFNLKSLESVNLAIDLIYNPLETSFLHQAKIGNINIVNGIDMLIYQAIPGFNCWFGVRPVYDKKVKNILEQSI